MGWLSGTEFAVLVSFKRLNASQILEGKLNLVMVQYVRDFYNCFEHIAVGNVLHSLHILPCISSNFVLFQFALYTFWESCK